jgi:hypothetical protein
MVFLYKRNHVKMKILNKFIYLGFVCMLGLFTSCGEDVTMEVLDSNSTGGLVTFPQSSYNYVVGTASDTYTFPFAIRQDSKDQVSEVIVYKSFYSVATGLWSNEVEDSRVTVGSGFLENVSFGKTFADLKTNLLLDGAALPDSDGSLTIGDYWQFRFVSVMANGNKAESGTKVKLTVSTRFAGLYNAIAGDYFRIGVHNSGVEGWDGVDIVVSSVDATTYRIEEYFGLFDGNPDGILFQIDPATLVITYLPDQLGNGQPMTTCPDNTNLTNVPCDGSNIAKANDDGKDELIMTFGYLTPGSGPREFFQSLKRK